MSHRPRPLLTVTDAGDTIAAGPVECENLSVTRSIVTLLEHP